MTFLIFVLSYPKVDTVSAQIRGRRLIKKLGFYGEILLNKMLRNWQILLNKVLGWPLLIKPPREYFI